MRHIAVYCPRWLRPFALVTCSITSLLIGNACCAAALNSVLALADQDLAQNSNSFQKIRFGGEFEVRGWKVAEDFYVGQAKIAGKWGIGLLVDKGDYAYGLNNEQVSFMKRF